jgi:hypothetical protein
MLLRIGGERLFKKEDKGLVERGHTKKITRHVEE